MKLKLPKINQLWNFDDKIVRVIKSPDKYKDSFIDFNTTLFAKSSFNYFINHCNYKLSLVKDI